MRRGFTLIELFAVIVILGIILAIAVPSVVGIIEKSRNDAWERQKGIIENTLDSYLLQNQSDIPWQDNKVIYSLEDLTDMGIVDKKITVPRNYQTDEVTIEIIKDDKGKFIYDISLPDELRGYLDTTYKNGAHFFVGANPNNWIEFGQVSSSNATPILWRIVKYDNEGIKIIYEGTKNGSNPPSEDGKIFKIPWADWTIPDPNKWDKSSDLKGLLYDWYENFYAVNKEKLVKPVKWCIGAVEKNRYSKVR